AGRSETKTVTVEPDPILGGDPARFAAQLRAGLELRNAMSALNETLNRIVSLETQLKNTQQALRDNAAGDTTTAAPITRQGRELGRKLKELKDSLYNSDVQDRKSTRLNSSHVSISYAVFCLKKKKKQEYASSRTS